MSTSPSRDLIKSAPAQVEEVRKLVNEGYSEAPEKLDSVFSTAQDQLTDVQFSVASALADYIDRPDDPALPQRVSSAVADAQRIGLGALRTLADELRVQADAVANGDVSRLQVETTDLVTAKRLVDDEFENAVNRHENNDPAALSLLLQCSRDYRKYVEQASAKKVGSKAVTTRERRRQIAAYAGVFLGVVSLIIGLINLYITFTKK